MRQCWVCKEVDGRLQLIPIEEYVPESAKTSYQVLQDTIADTWHPVTGEMCSSRTGMIKKAKEHGCEEWSPGIKKQEIKIDRAEIRERLRHFDSELRRDRVGTMEQFRNRLANG